MSKYQEQIENYFKEYPKASLGDVARALGCSKGTVSKYKPQELKSKPWTEEEYYAWKDKQAKADKALERLPWHVIKKIRNANNYRLYPVNWEDIEAYYEEKGKRVPGDLHSAKEFEALLKEIFDNLYDWKLYEPCPKCGKGIMVPRWRAGTGQYTPFSGCSEFPECNFSMDRGGGPIV